MMTMIVHQTTAGTCACTTVGGFTTSYNIACSEGVYTARGDSSSSPYGFWTKTGGGYLIVLLFLFLRIVLTKVRHALQRASEPSAALSAVVTAKLVSLVTAAAALVELLLLDYICLIPMSKCCFLHFFVEITSMTTTMSRIKAFILSF